MAARRPFADLPQLLNAAGELWDRLGPSDWLEAFAAHPRLGESGGSAPGSSGREQSRIMNAEEETLAELAAENRNYEARFGRVFLYAAAGRTGAEVLAALRQRMSNDSETELIVASAEQRKITRLRLESMLQR